MSSCAKESSGATGDRLYTGRSETPAWRRPPPCNLGRVCSSGPRCHGPTMTLKAAPNVGVSRQHFEQNAYLRPSRGCKRCSRGVQGLPDAGGPSARPAATLPGWLSDEEDTMRTPRTTTLTLAWAILFGLGVTPASAQPVYDIRAELIHIPNAYAVQIRNVGPAIPPPSRAEFYLALPAGLTVLNWTLNGWGCSPPPPVVAPVTIACIRNMSVAWPPGTILSNSVFFTSGTPTGLLGAVPPSVCVRSLLFRPNRANLMVVVMETNATNNSRCVP